MVTKNQRDQLSKLTREIRQNGLDDDARKQVRQLHGAICGKVPAVLTGRKVEPITEGEKG